jgi:PAS domain S-box-containing protein
MVATFQRPIEDDRSSVIQSVLTAPLPMIVTDATRADNPIIAANRAFGELTGYDCDEIVGRNCRFLAGEGTEPEARAALRQAVSEGTSVVVEMTNYRKNGSPFRNAVMIAPVRDRYGRVSMYVGSQMEVSDAADGSGLRRDRARKLVEALTRRQRQVLALMTAGYRNKQIGGELGIDEKTVKMHRARLLEALGARATAEAIRVAVEAELDVSEARLADR